MRVVRNSLRVIDSFVPSNRWNMNFDQRRKNLGTLLFDDPKSCGALRSTLKLFLRGCTLVALLRSVPFGPPPVAAPVLLLYVTYYTIRTLFSWTLSTTTLIPRDAHSHRTCCLKGRQRIIWYNSCIFSSNGIDKSRYTSMFFEKIFDFLKLLCTFSDATTKSEQSYKSYNYLNIHISTLYSHCARLIYDNLIAFFDISET